MKRIKDIKFITILSDKPLGKTDYKIMGRDKWTI